MKAWEMLKMAEEYPGTRFKGIRQGDTTYQSYPILPIGSLLPVGRLYLYDWQPVRTKVPAWQAIKALMEDRKTIISEGRYGRFHYTPQDDTGFSFNELIGNDWYIEGDE